MKVIALAVTAVLVASPASALPWETFADGGEYFGAFQDDETEAFQIEVNCDAFLGEVEVRITGRELSSLGGNIGTVSFSTEQQSFATQAFTFVDNQGYPTISLLDFDDAAFVDALSAALTAERDLTVDLMGKHLSFSGENASIVAGYMSENCWL